MKNLLKKRKKVKNYKTKYRIKYRLAWGQSISTPVKTDTFITERMFYWINYNQ